METRDDLGSIMPLLPLILRSSSLFWPSMAQETLKTLALGPEVSLVASGQALFGTILDLRASVGLLPESLSRSAAQGYELFFDELMSRMDSMMWFGDVVPALARLLLQLPSLLESHYQNCDEAFNGRTGLRIMGQQEAGIVFMSQELIASLLACALFCLFTSGGSGNIYIRAINFDSLFATLCTRAKSSQEHKINCLIHYFERVCLCMPKGYVSFERKVLPFKDGPNCISYPSAGTWRNSTVPLCSFKTSCSGFIEDQEDEVLEVDFANEYLGGGALQGGCVQEEIRFMVNPELIVGMLFMDSMDKNEAIEIVGVERFSIYNGYGSSFCFAGDFVDNKPSDNMGKRKTRIVAIDAVYNPGRLQYGIACLARETNKAFCGFYDCSKHECCLRRFHGDDSSRDCLHKILQQNHEVRIAVQKIDLPECSVDPEHAGDITSTSSAGETDRNVLKSLEDVGVATGNWGCGAFGGDPEIKSMIQWLAASQALRPFIHYYTFEDPALQRLEKVTEWISAHGWTVGELWSMLVEYSTQKLDKKTKAGFLSWILPAPDNTANKNTSVAQVTGSGSISRFFKKQS